MQPVPALHPLGALLTSADGNVEAPYISPPYDLFLILCLNALHRQRSAAVRALLGRGYLNLLVYVIGDRPVMVGAMRRPGLTPRTLGIRFWLPAREGSGLPLTGTLCSFQILAQPLVLFAQPLVVFFEPLQFLLPVLGLFPGLVSLSPRTAQFLRKFPYTPDRIEILEKQISL